MRIHQLPPAIANQIAAGEVIERPASVVKELLENSLDAGASHITIEIGYGGLNQIKISDNGFGIVAEDLPLAIAAHATSKITRLDDLYAIDSMGFRGEALASIASVAKVSISSRTVDQPHAMMLRVQGSEMNLAPCARAVGTTIDVVDLFFNAPVRKRFLKNEKLEFQAIEAVVKRFALSAPTIALVLKHNGKQIFSLPPALNEQTKLTRMAKIFGNAFMTDARFIDVDVGGMQLYGWLSGPDYQRSQNDRQWVYINQRMVKDKLINHALKQAYDGLLHPGRFPACLLYFTIDNAQVDVNVHPTKHEVRFQQSRLVHDFFTSQLAKVLRTQNEGIDDVHYDSMPAIAFAADVCEPGFYDADKVQKKSELRRFSHTENQADFDISWTVLNKQYIIAFIMSIPYIVDVIALQKHGLRKQLNLLATLDYRPLLVPVSYPLSSKLKNRTAELKHALELIGLHIDIAKEDTVLIRTIPIKIPYLDFRVFLDAVAELEQFNSEQIMNLLCDAQSFDPNHLESEERIALNQLLVESLKQETMPEKWSKPLTIDDCRMLLHV